MAHLMKYSEWQLSSGNWYCGDTEELGGPANKWYAPARMLGLDPADYIKLLYTEFKPDTLKYVEHANGRTGLVYSWKSQTQMRKFKNWINKKSREANFIV